MSIKDKLPYTEAAVMEVLRMSVTAPFGVGHYTNSHNHTKWQTG